MANPTERKFNFTDASVAAAKAPTEGSVRYYDEREHGLALRVTSHGARTFFVRYRTPAGRERYAPIGKAGQSIGEWKTAAARQEAGTIKARVRDGHDPLDEAKAKREAKSLSELCDEYIAKYLPDLRASTQRDYRNAINNDIISNKSLSRKRLAEITLDDIKKLHREKSKEAPHRANLIVVLLQGMFTQAVMWGWIAVNPVKIQRKNSPGIKLNPTNKRMRVIEDKELPRLRKALASNPDQQGAAIVNLLLLCGTRSGETMSARWQDIDEDFWLIPASATKAGKIHKVALAGPARALLAGLRRKADATLTSLNQEIARADSDTKPQLEEWRRRVETYVFPARKGAAGHRVEVRKTWVAICKEAGMVNKDGKPTIRKHDIRHNFGSVLVNAGVPIFTVMDMLGHSDPKMSERYSHLKDQTILAAAEKAGAIITGRPAAKVIKIGARRK